LAQYFPVAVQQAEYIRLQV